MKIADPMSLGHASLTTALMVATTGTLLMLYPNGRVLTWFEFLTDGWMPDGFANLTQDALARLWTDGFYTGVVQVDNQVSGAISEYLSRADSKWIIELAAGGGGASAQWTDMLRATDHPECKLLLTDLQPNVGAWDALKSTFPFVQYVDSSMDATDLVGSFEKASLDATEYQGGLRMINLALHHFERPLAKAVINDVIRTNSALLSGDLSPNRGGLAWNWLLSFKYALYPFDGEGLLRTIKSMPLWFPLSIPLIPFMATHDATVSVMRAYSIGELQAIVDEIPGGEKFEISTFFSKSFGDWLGFPISPPGIGLRSPVIQYFFLAPKALKQE